MSTATATLTRRPGRTQGKPLGGRFVGAAANYIDERTSLSGLVKELGRKIFPDHWSFMLGEIALWSFVVVLLSGTFLTFFFQASMVETHYTGAYVPMRGIEMSAALESSLHISFDMRGGLLVRQIHHWAALVFVAGIGVHMLRVFFTGAFRKPRELNWVIGFILFILAMAEGFTGYSLPDDLLSGNGLRIIDGMIKGIPLIGTWTSFLLFGGEFPGTDDRRTPLHAAHPAAARDPRRPADRRAPDADDHQQAHAVRRPRPHEQQRRGLPDDAGLHVEDGRVLLHHVRRDRADRVARSRSTRSGTTVRTTPPPSPPVPSPTGTSASRTARCVLCRRTWSRSSSTTPGRGTSCSRWRSSACSSCSSLIYPFIEAWITGDKREHHIAQRPRNAATRTAIGAAGVTFYAVLWAAASSDIIATHFWLTMEGVIHTLQALLILGPIIAYFVTKRICIALQKKDREIALHGYESGRIVRLPGGEFIEVHQPVDEYDRWKLVDVRGLRAAGRAPERARAASPGTRTCVRRSRAGSSRTASLPLTQSEIDAAVAHQHHALEPHREEEEIAEIQGAHERAGRPERPARRRRPATSPRRPCARRIVASR